MIGRSLAAVLLLVAAQGAAAQSVIYRCGNAYSAAPCSQAVAIDTRDSARTAEQRAEAVRVAASERRLADEMARDRQRAESAIKPAAGSLGPSRAATTGKPAPAAKAKKAKKGSSTEGEDFVAIAPKAKT